MSRQQRLDPRYLPLQRMLQKFHVEVEVNKSYKGSTWPIAAVYPGRSGYVYVKARDTDGIRTVYLPDGGTTVEAEFSYLVSLGAVQLVLAELASSVHSGSVIKMPSRIERLAKRFGLLKEKKNGVLPSRVTAD